MAKQVDTYSADALTHLDELEAVAKRPGMYIGSTDSRGLNHLVWEIVDNSVDEGIAGHADRIDIYLYPDGSVQVDDNGRGIPTGTNTKTGLSGVELALTKLHAGGKFGGSGYKAAGGLHGVGSSVVNALSARLDAVIYQNNKKHSISFQRGKPGVFKGDSPNDSFTRKSGLKVEADKRSAQDKKNRATGTSIRWWHDPMIFQPDSTLDIDAILTRARTTAFLVSGLTIAVHDIRDKSNELHEEFMFTGGIADMVEHTVQGESLTEVLSFSDKSVFHETVPVLQEDGSLKSGEVEREVEIDIALQWTTGYDTELRSYVNIVHTPAGGTHVKGFERGLSKAVTNALKERRGILKANEANPMMEDMLEGLTAVISVGFPEPQFEGQTKEKLGTNAIQKLVMDMFNEHFTNWLGQRKNANVSKNLLTKIVEASRTRIAQRELKATQRKKSALESSTSMPPKLVECEFVGDPRSELMLVEGDSALGTMRKSRDSRFQALFPLRGKVLNVQKATPSKMLENAECSAMIQVMGAGSGKTFDFPERRYDRIIIETDADVDGAHIKALLITFFWKYMREMVVAGKLYAALPPLYEVKVNEGTKNEKNLYALDDEELNKLIKGLKGKKYSLSRNKGLGEMTPDGAYQTLLNPETRKLKQITVNDVEASIAILDLAMGNAVGPRRDWISTSRHKISDDELDM